MLIQLITIAFTISSKGNIESVRTCEIQHRIPGDGVHGNVHPEILHGAGQHAGVHRVVPDQQIRRRSGDGPIRRRRRRQRSQASHRRFHARVRARPTTGTGKAAGLRSRCQVR